MDADTKRELLQEKLLEIKKLVAPKQYMAILAAIEKPDRPRMKRLRVKEVIAALQAANGIVAAAADLLGAHRNTIHNYIAKYPTVKKAHEESREIFLDFTESKLQANVRAGKEASVFFTLKTLGKKRGFVEKQIFEGSFTKRTGVMLIPGTLDPEEWDKIAPRYFQKRREEIAQLIGEGDGDEEGLASPALDIEPISDPETKRGTGP